MQRPLGMTIFCRTILALLLLSLLALVLLLRQFPVGGPGPKSVLLMGALVLGQLLVVVGMLNGHLWARRAYIAIELSSIALALLIGSQLSSAETRMHMAGLAVRVITLLVAVCVLFTPAADAYFKWDPAAKEPPPPADDDSV